MAATCSALGFVFDLATAATPNGRARARINPVRVRTFFISLLLLRVCWISKAINWPSVRTIGKPRATTGRRRKADGPRNFAEETASPTAESVSNEACRLWHFCFPRHFSHAPDAEGFWRAQAPRSFRRLRAPVLISKKALREMYPRTRLSNACDDTCRRLRHAPLAADD